MAADFGQHLDLRLVVDAQLLRLGLGSRPVGACGAALIHGQTVSLAVLICATEAEGRSVLGLRGGVDNRWE